MTHMWYVLSLARVRVRGPSCMDPTHKVVVEAQEPDQDPQKEAVGGEGDRGRTEWMTPRCSAC